MFLKTLIKFILFVVIGLFSAKSFSFDLTNNHYAAIEHVIKGKEQYIEDFGKPFTQALVLNKSYNIEVLSEKLAPLLTEDSTSFFFYGKDFLEGYLDIQIEDYKLTDSDITITDLAHFNYELQIIELKVPNQVIKANSQAKILMNTRVLNSRVFNSFISHHIQTLNSIGFTKNEQDSVKVFLEAHCVSNFDKLMMTIGVDTFKLNLETGYRLKTISISEQNFRQNNEIKYFVNGHFYDSEQYDNHLKDNIEISLIPLIRDSELSNYSEMIPVEVSSNFNVDRLAQSQGDFLSFTNHQLNYSIFPRNKDYQKNIGFLQDRTIKSFSQILIDKPFPSRKELSQLMDYNINYLGHFERDRFNKDLTPLIFQEEERELLIYKLYSKVKNNRALENEVALHLNLIENEDYNFNQSALFIDVSNLNTLKDLESMVNSWNKNHSSPQLVIQHFQKFAKLFKVRHGIRLEKTEQIESPFVQEFLQDSITSTLNWTSILSSGSKQNFVSDFLNITNPYSKTFTGLIELKHSNPNYKSAQIQNGPLIPIQFDEDKKIYNLLLTEFPAFGIEKLILSESKSKLKIKAKDKIKYNKSTGLVNWQFNGDKLSYKKEALILPYLKGKSQNTKLNYKKGKLLQKGILFDSFEYELNNGNIRIVTRIFKHKPLIQYSIFSSNLLNDQSIHTRFNFNTSPKSYSFDRILQKETGYSKHGNHNLIWSPESVFMINKTKIVFNSETSLKWENNYETFNAYRTGFEKSTTDPTRLYLYIDGVLDQKNDETKSKPKEFNFSIQLGEEKDALKVNPNKPIITKNIQGIKARKTLINIDNPNINIVNVHPTEEKGYYILEVKNMGTQPEKVNIVSYRKKSIVYFCNLSGKKTGIVKGKIKFEPLELKTIRIRL